MLPAVKMCQATAYLIENQKDIDILRDVIPLEVAVGGVRLHTFFEGPVTVQARVGRASFLERTVTLVPAEVEEDGSNEQPG